MMRKLAGATVFLAVAFLAGVRVQDDRFPTGPAWPGPADPACIEAARRSPDLVFTRARRREGVAPRDVPFWHLFSYDYSGEPVRVVGYLDGEKEPVSLYGSFEQAATADEHSLADVPKVRLSLGQLSLEGPARPRNRPPLSGRCARVEGWGRVERRGRTVAFEFTDVLRLEVWSKPVRTIHRGVTPPTDPAGSAPR